MKKRIAILSLIASCVGAQDFDILIRTGKIVDGAGSPSFHGDLGIKGGKIAAAGKLPNRTAAPTIEAKGLVVRSWTSVVGRI
jgi:N-acyl-D-amino-acid deacylase